MEISKKINFPTASILMLTLALAMSGNARAQVTMGANLEPQPFSVLELISNNTKGLRLPQLTTGQRDTVLMKSTDFTAEKKGKALGLQIFNLTTKCVETWNGTKWIEVCAPGTPFPEPDDIEPIPLNITTFVNVMYDFQYQEIYVYDTDSPVSYQWFAKRVGQEDTEYEAISDAKSATYTIPADFVRNIYQYLAGEDNPYYKSDTIMFACVAKYADDKIRIGNMDILFIGTNTSGYGELNGEKFLKLLKGKDGVYENDTMKVALLSLGQSADWEGGKAYTHNNNAADLGDFYQWGREADGHQNIVWSKNASHVNQILPYGTTPDNTSMFIFYNDGGTTPPYNTTTHQVEAGKYYGKFICSTTQPSGGRYSWYYSNGYDNSLWGTATSYTRSYQGSLNFDWDRPYNNPCPSGWRIPSRWNWWDIYNGNGSNTPLDEQPGNYSSNNNTWQWRSTNKNAIGGGIITNDDGEKIFFPAVGSRVWNTGNGSNDSGCYFWSSTYSKDGGTLNGSAYTLYFSNSTVNAGHWNTNNKGYGWCARCVVEPEP
ncbi:MAG: fibrobacter succinogenes major paralogous domain-containing protein [Prevotellaceae bacterium]|jgi:uncharacterized protein (TIGR02145 family)|nr:fibrobacter succinogenes major paralogous domain-containing protein [Prevotellaceae bacterium]